MGTEEPTIEQIVDHLNEHLGEHQQILVHLVHKVDELEGNLAAVIEAMRSLGFLSFLMDETRISFADMQFIIPTEGGEYVEDNEIHDWGMAFVSKVDAVVQKPGNESLKDEWMEGEWSNDIVRLCREVEPDITEEQLEWVEGFLSEI